MKVYRWQTLEEYTVQKDYGMHIPPRLSGILSILKKDDVFLSREFISVHKEEIKKYLRVPTDQSIAKAFAKALDVGVKIGMIKKLKYTRPGQIPFADFCDIPCVDYWRSQLNPSNVKNIKDVKGGSRQIYSYRVWAFHCWLVGREFEFVRFVPTGDKKFEQRNEKIALKGVDHLLELCHEPNSDTRTVVKIIKTFLLDKDIHGNKKAKAVELDSTAIKSFFRENDHPVDYSFNAKSSYAKTDPEAETRSMTLGEFFKILAKSSVIEKAVFLCKFHRGLDSSTLADRFNYKAFGQLVEYFKSPDHNSWDLSLCPVPITLVRVKTNFLHTGFLDYDAVEAIQSYLEVRLKKTGKPMSADQPLFLTKYNKPITTRWIEMQFDKLAQNAGLQRRLKGEKYMNKYVSHELRDLLKSTLIVCGTRHDVADHCIGHMPKDGYEKQNKLFDKDARQEFMKASSRINPFSNFSQNLQTPNSVYEKLDAITNRLAQVENNSKEDRKFSEQVIRCMLEMIENAQKTGNQIDIFWDKSRPFYFPSDFSPRNDL